MADTTVVDLSEDQIEQLLQEAEGRLSAKSLSQSETALVATKPGAQELARTKPRDGSKSKDRTATASSIAGPQAVDNLSVRIPQPPRPKSVQTAKDDAGPGWFNMPKTDLTPQLKRDLQLLKMRNVLDPKRHYRKDNAKSSVPTYSQVGTIVEGPTEFFSARIAKKDRKRTLLDEVLETEDTTRRFKSKYGEIQAVKTSGKKGYYKKMMEKRYGSKKR